ncbi:MAG: SDR family NAD(P)-dependent oxidoreductase [Victivallales bacterium]|jgi:NAD(P)-dependent dehydrogenase (short-subunit alcohol dehydrogenase family)/rhamnose utilization protein RhaD (predicted bifunctional aldolase and dehydrogenase)
MSLNIIAELSRLYGADPRYVLAGGGNTSYKDGENLYIKPSGIALAEMTEKDFVKMDRKKVRELFSMVPPVDAGERETFVKRVMENAVSHDSSGRPSVEAPLHEAMDSAFVVHLHPAFVNGMTCGIDGKKRCGELFPDSLWIDYVDPGYSLAVCVQKEIAKFAELKKCQPEIIFIQNHGVFIGSDNHEGIKRHYSSIMDKLESVYRDSGISATLETGDKDIETVLALSPKLRGWLSNDNSRMMVKSSEPFNVAQGPLTPDHIVYSKSFPFSAETPDQVSIARFAEKNGYRPLVVSIPKKAVFCTAKSLKDAKTVELLARDAALVQQLTHAFGGPNYLPEKSFKFIENWEVESYRRKIASGGSLGRLYGKVAVVTGAAQGFGLGIAEALASEGAIVAIADINLAGAQKAADGISAKFGNDRAFAAEVNIAREESVSAMVSKIVESCGGIDLFVANAGVLKAGPVKNFTRKDWDFVTEINYTGYFICVKCVSQIMSAQNSEGDEWTDIVQINSKSGLEGSSRNAAYAGSKFGAIGLTQSFALELLDDKIKVNSICPGNYFEGPLWSDSKNGLFVQYLNSGKVPGAKTLADVKKFYEGKVPMKRGCCPEDVAKAIIYCVEQKYETGQAIPVAGGQVMLN